MNELARLVIVVPISILFLWWVSSAVVRRLSLPPWFGRIVVWITTALPILGVGHALAESGARPTEEADLARVALALGVYGGFAAIGAWRWHRTPERAPAGPLKIRKRATPPPPFDPHGEEDV